MSLASIDYEHLAEIRELQDDEDPNFLSEQITMFCTRADELLPKIRDAFAQSDFKALEKAAHALAGTSGGIGAPLLSSHCSALENLQKRPGDAALTELVEKLFREFEIVKSLLEQESKKTAPSGLAAPRQLKKVPLFSKRRYMRE